MKRDSQLWLASRRMKTASSDQSEGVPGSHPQHGTSQSCLRCTHLGGLRQVPGSGECVRPETLSSLRVSERAWDSRYETVAQTIVQIRKTETPSALCRGAPALPFQSHQVRPPCQPSCSRVKRVSAEHDGTCSCGVGRRRGRGLRRPPLCKAQRMGGGGEGRSRSVDSSSLDFV